MKNASIEIIRKQSLPAPVVEIKAEKVEKATEQIMSKVLIEQSLRFSVKITDISELSNPFVIFENLPINNDGDIQIDQVPLLPWAKKASDFNRKTLKIEILHMSEMIVQRYIHFNRLFPLEYSKLAL